MRVQTKQPSATKSQSGEKGAVSIKSLLVFAFVIVVLVAAIKIVPVYVEEQQIFHDTDELARKASLGLNAYNKDKIQNDIQTLIREKELPEGSVSLVSQDPDRAEISIKYTRSIDFFVTTYNWDVDHTSVGKSGL